MDAQKHTGQCLCGTVKFTIHGAFESFFLCHCSRCRKDSGSAHSANLFSSCARLTWDAGETSTRTFTLPGSRHVKSFCRECGSALPFSQAEAGLVVVPAGSLDSRIDIRPMAHICCASRAEWDEGLAFLNEIEGLPG